MPSEILAMFCAMSFKYKLIIILIPIIFSAYYAIRGLMEKQIQCAETTFNQTLMEKQIQCIEDIILNKTQKYIIFYIQEVLFKIIVTISSFLSLFIAYYILSSLKSCNDIGTGTAVLLIFLFIWGIIGASGYLTLFIALGKIPNMK